MPDPKPSPAAFRDPTVAKINIVDLASAFAARLNVVNALSVDGVANAPREVLNYLGELADDFEALEGVIEAYVERQENGGPS